LTDFELVVIFTLDYWDRVSKAMVNDYSEKIESIASKLAAPLVRAYYLAGYLLVSMVPKIMEV